MTFLKSLSHLFINLVYQFLSAVTIIISKRQHSTVWALYFLLRFIPRFTFFLQNHAVYLIYSDIIIEIKTKTRQFTFHSDHLKAALKNFLCKT